MLRHKKAAIGEAITWLTATIIIVVVLSIFLFASSVMAKIKTINVGGDVDIDETNFVDAITNAALKIKSSNENSIEDWIDSARTFEK